METVFYDNGKVKAKIVNKREYDRRPPIIMQSLKGKDVYVEWFKSRRLAMEAITDYMAESVI